jgi:hypothetical protein
MKMASPWDSEYVKANLETIAQLQTNEHLKTAENGKLLAKFVRMPKGGLFTKAPSLSPIEFHHPVVNVFKKGGELTGWQTVHQEKTGKTITDFKEKITKETIRGAFGGLLVLLETYKGNTQRYELVKSVITDVMKVLRQVGDMDHVYRGGWKDKISIEGKKGKIVHKIDPTQLEVMLFQGMEALIKNPDLCNEATKAKVNTLNEQWIRNIYGDTPQLLWTQIPITGQMYQRQGSGICVPAALDWPRGAFRHPMGSLNLPSKYLPFGNNHKVVDVSDSKQIKAIYNDVGRNSAMLFAVSQLTNQAVIGNVPQLYLAFNGDEDHECPPVLWYKNIGVLFMSGFDHYASRIKEGGINSTRVVIEHACDVNVTAGMAGMYAGKLKIEGFSPIKDFGIESIRFDAEVLLEWGKKDMKKMEIALKGLKGVFTIMLSGNVRLKK